MTFLTTTLSRAAQGVAAALMAAMFLTFVLQITVRYSARLPDLAEHLPALDPSLYGWTLEFCLLLWVWLVFWGNAFVVREQDHVRFDILYLAVSPRLRRWFAIAAGLAIATNAANEQLTPECSLGTAVLELNGTTADARRRGFSSAHSGALLFLFCDGSVRTIQETIEHTVQRSWNGGAVVNESWSAFERLIGRNDGQPLKDY